MYFLWIFFIQQSMKHTLLKQSHMKTTGGRYNFLYEDHKQCKSIFVNFLIFSENRNKSDKLKMTNRHTKSEKHLVFMLIDINLRN